MDQPTVSAFPTPPSTTDPANFSTRADAFLGHFPTFVTEINAYVAFLASAAGRSAISAAYTFVSTTSGDPGPGGFRLNNATQTSATGAGLDLLDANGVDVSGIVARIGTGTSDVKGEMLVTLAGDPTVYLYGEVTSATSPSGYRSAVLQNVAGSSSGPFAPGDQVLVTYIRSGDKGDMGATGDIGPHAIYEEQRANNFNSSTPHVGTAHNPVALNTEVHDALGIFALNGSDVDFLQAGTYFLKGEVVAVGVGGFQANLYNVTDGLLIGAGLSSGAIDLGSGYYTSGLSTVEATVTIAGPKTIRLRAWTTGAAGSYAMGFPSASGLGERYARLSITKK